MKPLNKDQEFCMSLHVKIDETNPSVLHIEFEGIVLPPCNPSILATVNFSNGNGVTKTLCETGQ